MDSNIIKKANLSADKQAVREMNMALAQWEASAGYPDTSTLKIEDAMQVLANAGYNNDNWVCLTDGYQVYWYDKDNRMILYNSSTAEVEYPEEYDSKLMLSAGDHLHIYNENHVKAQQFVMKLNSSNATVIENGSAINSVTSSKTLDAQGKLISGTANSASNLTALASAEATIKGALGGNSSSALKLYATKEVISADTSKAYASLQISSVAVADNATEATPVLKDDGSYNENVYYLSVVGDKTAEGYSAAQKAASQYIYNIFDQITTGKIDDNVVIMIEPGTELDCSTCEWSPAKTFTGYFGSSNPEKPVVINGATISSKTGYAQTIAFQGSATKTGHSKYFVTGFFGTIYGDTTIENVTFKNIHIDQPATDFALLDKDISRNTVAIIGGITDGDGTDNVRDIAADVTIKNVNVENSSIKGLATVGGLVGYIGGAGDGHKVSGSIIIQDCNVQADLTSLATFNGAYHPMGGIVAFTTRSTNLAIAINNCTYTGKMTSNNRVGAIFGDWISQTGTTLAVNGGNYANVTFAGGCTTVNGTESDLIAGLVHSRTGNVKTEVTISGSPTSVTGYAPVRNSGEKLNTDMTTWSAE